MTTQLSREPVGELVSLINRLAHSLKKSNPDSDLPSKALDYLRRKGLDSQHSPLRDSAQSERSSLTATAEQRRVIEMLLSVCGAAFELSDDACEAEIDGEVCLTVPPDAFHKLSDALDEIEETLPAEDSDRPDVFLAWSAMPRAALKSLLHAAPPAPVAVPECFVRFHNVIKERHYGRMPEEVQNAFDECSSMLNQRSASVAKHINEPYTYPDFDEPPLVAVPDEQYQHLSELYHAQEKRLFKIAQRIKGPSFDKYAYSPSQAIDVLEAAIFGENEEDGSTCRAAMQSFGNSEQLEPVSPRYMLPDGGDRDE